MRISDWSSDVCSSDLDDRGRFALPPELLTACPVLGPVPPLDDPLGARLAGGRIFEPTGAHVEADPSTFATAPVLERTGWWMSDRLDGGRDGQIWRTGLLRPSALPPGTQEVGRAACRERVGQSV